MCGIVGIVHAEEKGAVDVGLLRTMNSTLKHRGPDDEGYWCDRTVGLAMRRLSIIDLEGGHQPLSNEDGTVWTVFNGEIYNFLELRDELLQKGHRLQTRSDTEVIVHLYEEQGESFVEQLRGMFAIALWDRRLQKLLLYRDRVGIKPLHYWSRNGTLLFASEIKAILEYPEVSREISLSALSDYLSFLYIPTPKTIYREVHKLPAGHFLCYQNRKIQIHPYWDFSYREEKGISEEEWAERLRAKIRESVRCHLVGDVPVGAFLSGGMDSSTVVAGMAHASASKPKTYSMGFNDGRFNELPYAREVAQRFGTDHHEKMVESDAFNLLPKIIAAFDEPFGDSSAIPTYLVSEFAREELKVVLSGDGGDELFAGYLWTRKELWLEKYRRLPLSLRRKFESFMPKASRPPIREQGLAEMFQRFLFDARLSPAESFARRAMCFQPWMKGDLFEPWVLASLQGREESLELIQGLFDGTPAKSLLDKLLYLDSRLYLPDDLLTKVDRMSMAHSLEVRVPLLDHQLIEFVGTIPVSLKLRGRTTKYILKKAMRDLLPPKILGQRKQGFGIPLERWFRGKLWSLAEKLLLAEESFLSRYCRLEYVRWMLEEQRTGRQRFGNQLYALVILELWGRLYEETRGRISSRSFTLKEMVG